METGHGDGLQETVADYARIRQRRETEGYALAPEE